MAGTTTTSGRGARPVAVSANVYVGTMKGPPRVGTASATAATVYTENLGEVANTSYGAIASLPIVPDVPSATATTIGPPEVGRLAGRAPLSRLGAGVFACARVTRRPAAASPARVSKAKAVEEARRRARRLRVLMGGPSIHVEYRDGQKSGDRWVRSRSYGVRSGVWLRAEARTSVMAWMDWAEPDGSSRKAMWSRSATVWRLFVERWASW